MPCLLARHVEWTDCSPPIVYNDDLYPDNGRCPFVTLKSYVVAALVSGKQVALVCDDSGGVEQSSEADEYDHLIIRKEMI